MVISKMACLLEMVDTHRMKNRQQDESSYYALNTNFVPVSELSVSCL